MSKAERGAKRVCSGCGAKFYDLNKDPIVCPLCETVLVTRETATRVKPAPPAAEKTAEEAEAPETEAAASGPEIVSLSEVEAEESGDDADVDDAGIDLGDDDGDAAEIPDDDDDGDAFLEEDEEGSDVTDIIPGTVKTGGDEA